MNKEQVIEVLRVLRQARALVSQDAEAFHRATLTLESVAHIAGSNVGSMLGQCREKIVSLVADELPAERERASELFATVLRARNMAIHGGAWIRHHTSRLVDLFLLLEEAIMSKVEVIEQIMVRTPLEAKLWQRVGHARNDMLSNSFSALPVAISEKGKERWMLLRDEAIMQLIAGKDRPTRDRFLSLTIEDARREGLELVKAETCGRRDTITRVAQRTRWPQLVIDSESGPERLVGIVTPFDLL